MYLVVNLTVADIFVGGFSNFYLFDYLLTYRCDIAKMNLSPQLSYHFYVWQSYCCLSLFVICVSYSCIVLKFLCGAHPPHHGAASRQRKLTITLFIMTIVSLLMWLPFAVASFLYFQSSL
ncbi:unnamed protein product, partial [Porites evermanni]